METVQLNKARMDAIVRRAAAVLRAGGVVLYPTDTLYGLGADALSDDAVAKIYAIKGRDDGKPIHAIVADFAMAEKYAEITDDARLLAERLPQGQVTCILRKKVGFDTGIMAGIATFGFRIPDNEFCIRLVREFGRPITATSANVSGQKPEREVEAILEQLRATNPYASLLQKTAIGIDLVIDAGELPERLPSTVVDLSSGTPFIIREGTIPAADIWGALDIEPDIVG